MKYLYKILTFFAGLIIAQPFICSGQFYNTGGITGNYSSNKNITSTICPSESNTVVTFRFTSFDIESFKNRIIDIVLSAPTVPIISIGQNLIINATIATSVSKI